MVNIVIGDIVPLSKSVSSFLVFLHRALNKSSLDAGYSVGMPGHCGVSPREFSYSLNMETVDPTTFSIVGPLVGGVSSPNLFLVIS